MTSDQPEADDAPQRATASPGAPPNRGAPSGVIPTDLLFRGQQEILISHKSEHYRLRITRNGKLILTK